MIRLSTFFLRFIFSLANFIREFLRNGKNLFWHHIWDQEIIGQHYDKEKVIVTLLITYFF